MKTPETYEIGVKKKLDSLNFENLPNLPKNQFFEILYYFSLNCTLFSFCKVSELNLETEICFALFWGHLEFIGHSLPPSFERSRIELIKNVTDVIFFQKIKNKLIKNNNNLIANFRMLWLVLKNAIQNASFKTK